MNNRNLCMKIESRKNKNNSTYMCTYVDTCTLLKNRPTCSPQCAMTDLWHHGVTIASRGDIPPLHVLCMDVAMATHDGTAHTPVPSQRDPIVAIACSVTTLQLQGSDGPGGGQSPREQSLRGAGSDDDGMRDDDDALTEMEGVLPAGASEATRGGAAEVCMALHCAH